MKSIITLFIGLFFLMTSVCKAETAPVVYAGSELYAVTTASAVYIPVTVSGFSDIGFFRLTLTYPTANATYNVNSYNLIFSGLSVNASTPGTIIITWTGTQGVTLPDNTTIITLNFTFITGTAPLSWDLTGTACQFKKYAGGSFTDLDDLPKSSHYLNGKITESAPVFQAATFLNVQNGPVTVPVTVEKFKDIASGTLYMSYDTTVLTYQSTLVNSAIGTYSSGTVPGPGTRRYIVIMWYTLSSGITLNDGSLLCRINFIFNNQNGTYSRLTWFDTGPSCKIINSQSVVLNDIPASDFYKDGLVASVVTPETSLPFLPDSPVSPAAAPVPVKVRNFSNISGFNLWFSYDPLSLTFPAGAFTPNPSLGGTMTVNNLPANPDGKARMNISWTGVSSTLPDNSDLVTLNFNLSPGSSSILKWITASDSCEYHSAGKDLWKSPVTGYFRDGVIGSHLAPVTSAPDITSIPGQTVIIPLQVSGFSNISGFTLTLLYDPGVLNFQNVSLTPPLGGSFSSVNAEPGLLVMTWAGSPASLPDHSTLINASFVNVGGTSGLQWNTSGTASFYSGPGVLYDLPKSSFYINGSAAPVTSPVNAKIRVFLEGPYYSGNMSTGISSVLPLTQPFQGSPFYYAGTEQVTSIPAGVTDWILVELRTDPWSLSRVASRAGFIKSDGMITDVDGASDLHFSGLPGGYYYLVVRHRNHLPVMSALPVSVTSTGILYDFTTGSAPVYGGAGGCKLIDPTLSKWGMIAGDANQSSSVYVDDYTDFWLPQFGNSLYTPGDFNMDGSVYINDYTDYWMINFGRVSTCPN